MNYLEVQQGFKEATFNQTGMRGGYVEVGREARRDTVWHGKVVVVEQARAVTHSHLVDKIGRDTLGAGDPSPRPDDTA